MGPRHDKEPMEFCIPRNVVSKIFLGFMYSRYQVLSMIIPTVTLFDTSALGETRIVFSGKRGNCFIHRDEV